MSAVYEDFKALRRPVVTEKSYAAQGATNQYSFRVEPAATKQQIKHAVEAVFEVKVENERTSSLQGE